MNPERENEIERTEGALLLMAKTFSRVGDLDDCFEEAAQAIKDLRAENAELAEQLRVSRQSEKAAWDFRPELEELASLRKDAARYRWLRDYKCNSLYLTRDGDHACNYMSASDWIDDHPEAFRHADPIEVEQMKATNTIWQLQIYPDTPIGSYTWNGSTLDAAIDAAMSKEGKT